MVVVLVRKPLIKNVVNTINSHNCGGINIDGTRVGEGTGEIVSAQRPNMKGGNYGQDSESYEERNILNYFSIDKGRFPANVLLSETTTAIVDDQSGITHSPKTYVRNADGFNNGVYSDKPMIGEGAGAVSKNFGDSGGASRYFKVFK
tara:strand:- start:99 stop:539 length:441 start_codon:yes stop_codon:yes gene_type:complete